MCNNLGSSYQDPKILQVTRLHPMAHLELEAEVGAGNHLIKHTHAERSQSQRGGEKLQVRATKEEERDI